MDQLQEEKKDIRHFFTLLISIGGEKHRTKIILVASLVVIFLFATLSFFQQPPSNFPINTIITIDRGTSLRGVATMLYQENAIRSKALFEFCAKVEGGEKPVSAGSYLFKEPISACAVASRIARGVSGVPAIRITIPEGTSNNMIAEILGKSIPQFDQSTFLDQMKSDEGYLFPDTYFFFKNITIGEIETAMRDNFDKKILPLQSEISASGHSLSDIIIMASILEKEATTNEDRALVSGILWKRIAKGMPLQVDAPFLYLLGKTSAELTPSDLKMNSPYNTYQNKGLPRGPIGNPGISAIQAAINPTASPYLYYLSDKNGVMHYAKTFEEHKANKAKYLK